VFINNLRCLSYESEMKFLTLREEHTIRQPKKGAIGPLNWRAKE